MTSCLLSFLAAFWAYPSEGRRARATINASSSARVFGMRLPPACKPICLAPEIDLALLYRDRRASSRPSRGSVRKCSGEFTSPSGGVKPPLRQFDPPPKATGGINRCKPCPLMRPALQAFVQNCIFLLAGFNARLEFLKKEGVGRIKFQTLLVRGDGVSVFTPSQEEITHSNGRPYRLLVNWGWWRRGIRYDDAGRGTLRSGRTGSGQRVRGRVLRGDGPGTLRGDLTHSRFQVQVGGILRIPEQLDGLTFLDPGRF